MSDYVYTILQDIIDGDDVKRLLPFLDEIDTDLFHQILSTRCVCILRYVMDQNVTNIQRISPEQLEFFTYGEKKHVHELGKVLIEYGYVFGTDETSALFRESIMENINV